MMFGYELRSIIKRKVIIETLRNNYILNNIDHNINLLRYSIKACGILSCLPHAFIIN